MHQVGLARLPGWEGGGGGGGSGCWAIWVMQQLCAAGLYSIPLLWTLGSLLTWPGIDLRSEIYLDLPLRSSRNTIMHYLRTTDMIHLMISTNNIYY